MDGFGGFNDFAIFGNPASYIDLHKPAGHTSDDKVLAEVFMSWKSFFRLTYMLYTPNIIWFSLAFILHFGFPYEIEAFSVDSSSSTSSSVVSNNSIISIIPLQPVLHLFILSYIVAFTYYGFFHVKLYDGFWSEWRVFGRKLFNSRGVTSGAKRKYIPK